MYVFDVVKEQKPSRLLELNVIQSNNITIRKEDTPPLFIEVSRNVNNITYSLRTLSVDSKFPVLYEQNGTLSFQSNGTNGNATIFSGKVLMINYNQLIIIVTIGASALEHRLFLTFLCSTVVTFINFLNSFEILK